MTGRTDSNINRTIARELLSSTKVPRDKLPYTEEFDRLHAAYCAQSVTVSKYDLMQEFFNLAKKGGFSGRASKRAPIDTSIPQEIFIGKRLAHQLSARGRLVYTTEFDQLHQGFNAKFGTSYSIAEFWLIVDGMAKKSDGTEWTAQLNKSREAACLAVELYNKPMVTFRSGCYIVLMNIAWTALMHAMFFRWGIKPFYRDDEHPGQFKAIDGDHKSWELAHCLKQFYGDESSPVWENLKLFIGLRNKIEHRSLPNFDSRIFGECQAMLLNYEDMLFDHFGPDYALAESLSLALQFSHLRSPEQAKAVRKLHAPLPADILNYIDAFRSSLSEDIRSSLAFSYRVFLIPQSANRECSSDLAVQFIKFDPNDPKQAEQYSWVPALLKPAVTQVANQGRLKAADVCREVEPTVKKVVGIMARFTASHHHVAAWRFYKIRPANRAANPQDTNPQYCHYDQAHRDYVYTDGWVKFLIQEMKKPGNYNKIMQAHSSFQSSRRPR